MLYLYRILNIIGLKVKLPMNIEVDSQVAIDFKNSYSFGRKTYHVELHKYYLR